MSVKRGLSRLLLYPAAARARMPLRFEVLHGVFKLFEALSKRKNVIGHRVVYAFQRFDEARNFVP
jgi:hypothetical protein